MMKKLLLFMLMIMLGMAPQAVAVEFEIHRLTNNSVPDLHPSLYNGTIAWHGNGSGRYDIYYWDGSVISNLTNDYGASRFNSYPSLYNGTIDA